MQEHSRLDHARCDVVADEEAMVAVGAQKAKEIAEPAPQVEDGSVRLMFEETQKLTVTQGMGLLSIPVDAARGRAMLGKPCRVVGCDVT